jgi:hypothetical protein
MHMYLCISHLPSLPSYLHAKVCISPVLLCLQHAKALDTTAYNNLF